MFVAGSTPTLAAQSLPPYAAISPMLASRSGLYFQPYLDRTTRWRAVVLLDYANAIEVSHNAPADYLLHAEVLRGALTLSKDIRPTVFVLLSLSVNGSYNGFLDPFLNWYHRLFGFRSPRTNYPDNQFEYHVKLPDGTNVARQRSSAFLGDVGLGVGVRHSAHWQTMMYVTLPTTMGPVGYGRGVTSANLISTYRSGLSPRLTYEGSLGVGYTPRYGDLGSYQTTTFGSASSGLRFRFAGAQAFYANLFYQSATYHRTSLSLLDGREFAIDVGFVLKARKGPEWILGLGEFLFPTGAANDPTFRIGARW